MKIKYLDQIRINGQFQTTDQIKAVKPRFIEAIGYLVKKDDNGYLIAGTINGNAYNNLLFIPKTMIIDVDDDFTGREVEYMETQGMSKQLALDTLPKPPIVKLCGFLVYEDGDNLAIAQELNADGKYRTTTVVPTRSIIETVIKKGGKAEK